MDLNHSNLKKHHNFKYKTRHSNLYIYVAYSRPSGWTEWADIFCEHSWVAGGCYRLKKIRTFFSKYVFQVFFPRATPGPAGQTDVPNRLTFFEDSHGWPGSVFKAKKIFYKSYSCVKIKMKPWFRNSDLSGWTNECFGGRRIRKPGEFSGLYFRVLIETWRVFRFILESFDLNLESFQVYIREF